MDALAASDAGQSPADGPALTWVELVRIEGRPARSLRFGTPVRLRPLSAGRRLAGFAPGAVFALLRSRMAAGRPRLERLDIAAAAHPGRAFQTLDGVAPGAVILLRALGPTRVQAALAAIDRVEALGVDPALAAPDHWRCLHNRLAARLPARPYSPARHRAWRLRLGLRT